MRKKVLIGILIILSLIMSFGLVSCNDDTPDDDIPDSTAPEIPEDELALIIDGKALFKVVTSSNAGGDAVKGAEDFVKRLRELGVEISDVITDKSSSNVAECEIIIGTNVKNRPSDCIVTAKEVINGGYAVKVVGKRVIIAGEDSKITSEALLLFIKDQLGVTSDTKVLDAATVKKNLNILNVPDVSGEKLLINGYWIKDHVIACDNSDTAIFPSAALAVQASIKNKTGYTLDIVDIKSVASGAKKIYLKNVNDVGKEGFQVFVSGGDLMVECEYPKLFLSTLQSYLEDEIKSGGPNISLSQNYSYKKDISTIRYSDFGAVGDGKTNDYTAIYRTHIRANETGQKVAADPGKTYLIKETWDTGSTTSTAVAIPIKTDVDWTGATFYIQDKLDGILLNKRYDVDIFSVTSDYQKVTYTVDGPNSFANFSSNTNDWTLAVGQKSMKWITPALTSELSFIKVVHGNHYDFKRFGKNQDNGYRRSDVMIIDRSGNFLEGTEPVKEFKWETNTVNSSTTTESITSIEIISVMDKPITITGGKFITDAYTCEAGTAQSLTFNRAIWIERANVTLKNLDHEVINETAEASSVYPYSGFLDFVGAYNCTVLDTKLCGHKEDIRANSNVSMGSYDLQLNTSINIAFKNLTQHRDIKNKYYWGLSSSNGCKNLKFDNCKISRVDAHAGLWGLEITNSHIGQYINVVGGGKLKIVNTVRYVSTGFITLRNDYGTTFNGDVEIKNCTMYGYKLKRWNENDPSETPYNFTAADMSSEVYLIEANFDPNATQGTNVYGTWDFGFKSYMPTTVTIDNFVCKTNYYVFNDIVNEAFASSPSKPNGPYNKTQKITYKNMTAPTICEGASCTELLGIPLIAG